MCVCVCVRYNNSDYILREVSTHTHTDTQEEVIMAEIVHQLKERLDKYKYGDRTARV